MLIGSTDDYQMALELWTLNIFVFDKNDFKIELNSLFYEKIFVSTSVCDKFISDQ